MALNVAVGHHNLHAKPFGVLTNLSLLPKSSMNSPGRQHTRSVGTDYGSIARVKWRLLRGGELHAAVMGAVGVIIIRVEHTCHRQSSSVTLGNRVRSGSLPNYTKNLTSPSTSQFRFYFSLSISARFCCSECRTKRNLIITITDNSTYTPNSAGRAPPSM